MFGLLKPKTVVVREGELQKVVDILFPPLETVEKEEGVFVVDYSIDSNLEAALLDLRDGTNDAVVQTTIRKAIERLQNVRKILLAEESIDKRAQVLMVDNPD